MGDKPTRLEKFDIAARRDRLRTRIESFQLDAINFIGVEAFESDSAPVDAASFFDLLDDIPGGTDAAIAPSNTEAEETILALPSQLSENLIQTPDLQQLRAQELELRRGQAHDILERIRLAIGQKSFQYTDVMRQTDRKAVVTRSRSAVATLSQAISLQRRFYFVCRAALVRLHIPPTELEAIFLELKDDDLKTSTAILDPNMRGQSRQQLAWIWRVGGVGAAGDDPLTECELYISNRINLMKSHENLVKRVHWMRARAQLHRWQEENILTAFEMDWTTRFFLHKVKLWGEVATFGLHSRHRGGEAFAERQKLFWKGMALRAETAFGLCNDKYRKLT